MGKALKERQSHLADQELHQLMEKVDADLAEEVRQKDRPIAAENCIEPILMAEGAAYEGLPENSASAGKKGAGQYSTPRVLIDSIIHVMRPDPRVNQN